MAARPYSPPLPGSARVLRFMDIILDAPFEMRDRLAIAPNRHDSAGHSVRRGFVSTMSTAETPFSLAGEVALITGGGSGLGLGMAQCFVKSGARVVLVGRNEARLRAATGQLGPQASYEVVDLTHLESLGNLVERIEAREGRISILINNAGNHLKKLALDTTDTEFATVLNIHVNATFSLTRLVAAAW
jgi:NADP-dependent 3-hydroxy acid dehydrogenase YdfG